MEHQEKFMKLMERRKEQELSRNLKENNILEKQIISMKKANDIEDLFGETKYTI